MVVITIEKCENAKINTVKVGNKELFCIRMIDIQNGLGLKNMSDLVRKEIHGIFSTDKPTSKQIKKYKRSLQELNKCPMDDSKIKYVCSDLIEKIVKNFKGVKQCKNDIDKKEKEKQRENFRILLGFKENDIYLTKEQSVLKPIMEVFEEENMQTQYSVLGYKIDLYFDDHKLAVEIDEKGHKDRNINDEIQLQKALGSELGCEFIRINPDEENFNIFKAIIEINRHIKKSTKEINKKSLIDKLLSRLLKMEFKSDDSIKTKLLKHVAKKVLSEL